MDDTARRDVNVPTGGAVTPSQAPVSASATPANALLVKTITQKPFGGFFSNYVQILYAAHLARRALCCRPEVLA
uniref:Uncharacterized protein n=1 Tax=Paramormyrops kingsleyae TaxID=1676925 RepID=A0A3B3RC31_9TELE